ncbi:histone deacetylase [Zhongshania sp.]|uniref:histone deacetylase family protein n=1 Tax=Zhongshania sp. TaxID=1971902 RepID=UPI00356474E8
MRSLIPLVSNPLYSYPFDSRHRFPMEKFSLLFNHLREIGIAAESNVFRPGRVRSEVLALAHCRNYINDFCENQLSPKAMRRMGLPWSEGLRQRSLISPNGTLLTAQLALKYGMACHLAGGTHHAHYDFASGFCIFNDLAVTARTLLAQGKVQRILIFDCDVHQGDGTASILQNDMSAFTCSVHCDKNFPARKARSDLDINVAAGSSDQAYLELLSAALEQALLLSKPDLVLYDAGVDIYEHDPLGLLNISTAGIRERDRLVLETCVERGIAVATVIGGGYDRDQQALARRHGIAVEEAARLFTHLN